MRIQRKARVLLYSNGFLHFSAGMLGPLFAVFAEKVGGNILDVAWAWAVYLIVCGVLIIFVGRISDSMISKEKLLFLGYLLGTLLTFSYVFVASPLSLLLVQAGLGFAVALILPTWDALYDESSNRKYGGTMWGIADAIPNLAAGPAIIIGGSIVKFGSFTFLFLLMGTFQLFATIMQLNFKKR